MLDFFSGYNTDGGNLAVGTAEVFEPYVEGDSLRVYVPANMQGVLLPNNTNSDNKTADAVTAAGGNPDLCTYLEIYGTAQGFAQMNGNVAYRFFLGGDNTSDFSVEPGHALAVIFTPTEAGITRPGDWWKVEKNLTAAVPMSTLWRLPLRVRLLKTRAKVEKLMSLTPRTWRLILAGLSP